METIKFEHSEKYEAFHKELLAEVASYFKINKIERNANAAFWLKAVFWLSISVACYIALFFMEIKWLFVIFFLLHGWALFLFNLNVAHDAAHFSVFNSRKKNQFLYNLCFYLMGNSPYIWQKNHCREHHLVPNVIGKDPDVIETPLLRFYPQQSKKKYHRFQHLYAPLLYAIHAPVYFFFTETYLILFDYSDYEFTLSKRFYALLGKMYFIASLIILPSLFTPFSIVFTLVLFVLLQMSWSLFLVFGLGISHLNDKAIFFQAPNNECSDTFIKVQLFSSADYNLQSRLAHFILGGFNTHGLHHLFANTCHIHYREIAPVLISVAKKHHINYSHYSYLELLKSHFNLLFQLRK